MAHKEIYNLLPDDATYQVEWSIDDDISNSIDIELFFQKHRTDVMGCDDNICYIGSLSKEKMNYVVRDLMYYGVFDGGGFDIDYVAAAVTFTEDGRNWISVEDYDLDIDEIEKQRKIRELTEQLHEYIRYIMNDIISLQHATPDRIYGNFSVIYDDIYSYISRSYYGEYELIIENIIYTLNQFIILLYKIINEPFILNHERDIIMKYVIKISKHIGDLKVYAAQFRALGVD